MRNASRFSLGVGPDAGHVELCDKDALAIRILACGCGPALRPDAARVALVYAESEFYGRQVTHTLMVFDAGTGERVAAERHLEFRPSLLEYGRDGSELVIYGAADGPNRGILKPGAPRVLLLNAKTLQVTWDRLFPDILSGEWCEESCGSGIEYYNDNMKFVRWPPALRPWLHDRYPG